MRVEERGSWHVKKHLNVLIFLKKKEKELNQKLTLKE